MSIAPPAERLHHHVRQWNVIIENTVRTETSLIAFGVRDRDRRPVVVKVAKRQSEEWHSGELLAAFEGKGLVRAIEYTEGAVLLERFLPGHDLASLAMAGHDEEATEIIAGIITEMLTVQPGWPGVKKIETLADEFQTYAHSCDGLMPSGMVDEADSLFRWLCATQSNVRLLHGDLHHANVLFDLSRGWVAIDPWGVQAEIEYEVGASLRNPINVPNLLASADTLKTRLRIFETRLALNPKRALQWAFASAVLAALWPMQEDGVDMRVPFITAAKTMMFLLAE